MHLPKVGFSASKMRPFLALAEAVFPMITEPKRNRQDSLIEFSAPFFVLSNCLVVPFPSYNSLLFTCQRPLIGIFYLLLLWHSHSRAKDLHSAPPSALATRRETGVFIFYFGKRNTRTETTSKALSPRAPAFPTTPESPFESALIDRYGRRFPFLIARSARPLELEGHSDSHPSTQASCALTCRTAVEA